MIIVSQDKGTIINFRNVTSIRVRKLPPNETGYAISIDTVDCLFDRFALYDTEERAKEVLQEIVKNYRNCKTAQRKEYTNILLQVLVFEMPKE